MNYSELKFFDVVDGEGIRVSLFVSGCEHHCKGCFNSDTWDYSAGKKFTIETMKKIIESLRPEYIKGFSLLGGDPLAPKNVETVARIVKSIREEYNDKKDIWLWTGYLYSDLMKESTNEKESLKYILDSIDVLVDGPFIQEKKDLSLEWRGSSNQKIYRM